jgi:ADP-ribose pyrophosphatase YjhB (NUDIX family)
MHFTSLQELHAWLEANGIDTTIWGQLEGTKTVLHLWDEIVAGETVLQDEPPLRIVNAVEIIIRQGNLILVEVAQEMVGGGTRPRHYPPSEKIKRGETYQQAAIRGLFEELNIPATAITLQTETYQQRQRQIPSISYPGLNTLYQLHSLEAHVNGLPSDNFTTNEAAGNSHDPVTRHHWAWLLPDKA